jgi:8-oxo-dGTP pyrophosphatase MutT (NUDIX family)
MNEAAHPPTLRQAARVLLLDSSNRVFLMLFAPGQDGDGVWITPGGGLEPGETFEQAAARELWEEVGLRDFELGPCVWHRSHTAEIRGRLTEQQERFFIVRVEAHDPGDHVNHDEWERDQITDQRWWTLDEIIEAKDKHFGPRDLPSLIQPILLGSYPDEPLVLGL